MIEDKRPIVSVGNASTVFGHPDGHGPTSLAYGKLYGSKQWKGAVGGQSLGKMPDIPRIISGVEPAISSLSHTAQYDIRSSIAHILRKPTPTQSLGKYRSLATLRRNHNIIITRSDKGSQTVVLDTADYASKMTEILSDRNTFVPITQLDASTSTKSFRLGLLRLKKSGHITPDQYSTFTSDLNNTPYIYGLPKTHKPDIPLRPIIAYHLSPAYKLSKYLTGLLTPWVKAIPQSSAIRDIPSFIQSINSLRPIPDTVMVSYDVVAMYLSLPHQLIIRHLTSFLQDNQIDRRTAESIVALSSLCLDFTTFTFNNQLFKQIRGSPMGSPLSSPLAEIVMANIDHWVQQQIAPGIHIWRRYIDDIFCICDTGQETNILNSLNSYHPEISFTLELENRSVLPYLDILVIRTASHYHTTVYHKVNNPTFYTDYKSSCPLSHKINTVRTLTKRLSTHCSLPLFRTIEFSLIIKQLARSQYPPHFIHRYKFDPSSVRPPAITRHSCTLPFSIQSVSISRILRTHGINTHFTNSNSIGAILRHPITKLPRSTVARSSGGSVYSVSCNDCSATYIGETGRSVAIRMTEHGRCITNRDNRSLIFNHVNTTGHSFNLTSPTTIYNNIPNKYQRLIIEAIVSIATNSINRHIDLPTQYQDISQLSLNAIRRFTNLNPEAIRLLTHLCRKSLQLARWRLHLDFNKTCQRARFIPPSLRVADPVGNSHSNRVILRSQRQLLWARIQGCYTRIRCLSKTIKTVISQVTSLISQSNMVELLGFLTADIRQQDSIIKGRQYKKLSFWISKYGFPEEFHPDNQPVPTLLNLSSTVLSPSQTEVLTLGLKYRPPTVPDIPRIISGVEPAISSLSHTAQYDIRSSIAHILRKPTPTQSLGKYRSLATLRRNHNIIITRSDKGSQTVVLDTADYASKMTEILSDRNTFVPITQLDASTSTKSFRLGLLRLKKSGHITPDQYSTFTSDLNNTPYIYGLPKTHKPDIPLRPIIAYHLSPAYKLSKYLTGLLTPWVKAIPQSSAIRDIPSFIQSINSLRPIPDTVMVSYDVVAMYLSLPHQLIIRHLTSFLQDNQIDRRTAESIVALSSLCLDFTTFTFNNQLFKQIRGSPMGSPLSSPLAEIVMANIDHWVQQQIAPGIHIWRRYIDDIFCICDTGQETNILNSLNSYHPEISFTLELENRSVLPYLNILVIRTASHYHTTVYHKVNNPTFYTDYKSSCPLSHKINTVQPTVLTPTLLTAIASAPSSDTQSPNYLDLPLLGPLVARSTQSHVTIAVQLT
ncbi:hypothetical protein LAZ67_19001731 [Cordylochernes scorpioides]|uniref:Reverse transcriptase domain-containing protein n=1 Tax=Cordylochernes scorpioides TaxID=51811 RepID=A0ABY6LIX2_9ARAC|nr:hypothetical protein LAZ67_19001731 [Cordylochernes scorpioides]